MMADDMSSDGALVKDLKIMKMHLNTFNFSTERTRSIKINNIFELHSGNSVGANGRK